MIFAVVCFLISGIAGIWRTGLAVFYGSQALGFDSDVTSESWFARCSALTRNCGGSMVQAGTFPGEDSGCWNCASFASPVRQLMTYGTLR